jgi:hypothetical protein
MALANRLCPVERIHKEIPMEFRWIAILALWTMLVGPMLNGPLASRPPQAAARR